MDISATNLVVVFALGTSLLGCDGPINAATDLPATDEFSAVGCVEINGYTDDAMEPFITADGRQLLFNNRNSPAERTDLHWASRIDDAHFTYVGKIPGANSDTLDAVPSLDINGLLYFVSLRSYGDNHSTLYRGTLSAGQVADVALVPGISGDATGRLHFDAEISHDGATLYFVDGHFSGGAVPDSADIVIAHRDGDRFVPEPHSADLLAAVNTAALEYAPAISRDGLELYFTRLDMKRREIGIYRVTRASPDESFMSQVRIAATDGFVEAPTLSSDGATMYFHRLDEGKFHICRAVRHTRRPN